MKKRIFVLFGWLAVLMLVAAPVAVAAPTTPTADFTDNGDAQDHRTGLDALCEPAQAQCRGFDRRQFDCEVLSKL